MTDRLDGTLDSLARALASDTHAIAADVMERMRRELPSWMLEPTLFEMSHTFARESINVELDCLRTGRLPEICPPVDVEAARRGARAGMRLDVLLLGYRAGHAAQWDAWFRAVEADVEDDLGRRALLERGSRFFFDYCDRLSRLAAEEHTDERDRMLRGFEHRRVSLVRDLLDGGEVASDELGYDPEGHHIGVMATGPDPEAGLRELADRSDRTLLAVGIDAERVFAWLGGRRRAGAGWARVAEDVARQRGLRLCCGDPSEGPEGFRRTHHQAQAAQMAPKTDPEGEIVHYDRVALEALAASDEREARAFVARELSGLEGDGARPRRLRETLDAYFASGHNAAAAAATLGVHEQTVAARLRTVEERIGWPVATRRAELETALRLRRYLG